MSAFNSRTKCTESPGVIHDRRAYFHPDSWAWMRPQVPDHKTERSFDSQTMQAIDVLGLSSWHVIQRVCVSYDQPLADARSTDAGNKCLYCKVCVNSYSLAIDCPPSKTEISLVTCASEHGAQHMARRRSDRAPPSIPRFSRMSPRCRHNK